jgi:hypothetical protein
MKISWILSAGSSRRDADIGIGREIIHGAPKYTFENEKKS